MTRRSFGLVVILVGMLFREGAMASATTVFRWHAKTQRMDADFERVSLTNALGKVAKATGWRVLVESKTDMSVSARFSNVSATEGLRLMLDNLSFALIGGSNGVTKLYVFKTGMGSATNMLADAVLAPEKTVVVTNELVLKLKPGGGKTAAELAAGVHGEIVGKIDSASAYRLRFADAEATQAARDALQSDSAAASVDSNYIIEKPNPADPAQAASMQPFNLKVQAPTGSDRVVVGLVDEPVQPLQTSMQQFLLPSLSAVGSTTGTGLSTDPTHGTSMAEILLQQLAASSAQSGASPVKVLPVDVYGGSQTTTSFDVATGITMAVNNGANIVNLSLGGSGDSQVLHDVITAAKAQGVLFFAAAGNEPVTTPTYPAAYPEVVAVTAVQGDGAVAPYANRGAFIAVGAPGDALVPFGGQA